MKIRDIIICVISIAFTLPALGQMSYGGQPLPFSSQLKRTSSSNNLFVEMPTFDVNDMLKEDSLATETTLRRVRFAKKFQVNITPENAGMHFTTEDGTNVWRVGLRSKGAYSLNVLFTEFHLPEGAQLFLYNADQSRILGAFTEKNNTDDWLFPVAPVPGDELIIEYHEPTNAVFNAKLVIGEVNHDYLDILKKRPGEPGSTGCHENAVCRDEFQEETQAVSMIIVDGRFYCSSSMINNVEEDKTPYLLTACHCIDINGKSFEEVAKTVVVFFNYQSPSCNSDIRGTEEMSMVSPQFRAADRELDFALLELAEIPPPDFRPYYLGWNLSPQPQPSFVCIHQPNGGIKKIAESSKQVFVETNQNFEGILFKELWRVTSWDSGTTEGGSSGSPLLDANKQLIGALTGGSSTCRSPKDDYYWTLKKAWDYYPDPARQLKQWLNPNNKDVSSVSGLNPYDDETGICNKISNIKPDEQYQNYYLNTPKSGTLFGYNNTGSDEYAERFVMEQSGYLYGVSLVTPVLQNPDNDKHIYLAIYEGNNKPEYLIEDSIRFFPKYMEYASKEFGETVKPFNKAAESYVRFSKPIKVNKEFYISYKINYEKVDSFSVYAATNRTSGINTSYFKQNGLWHPVNEHPELKVNTSLAIHPVLSYKLITGIDNPSYERNDKIIKMSYDESGFVRLSTTENLINAQIVAYDLSGRKLVNTDFIGNVTKINLSELPKGIYILRVEDESQGVLYREKFIH